MTRQMAFKTGLASRSSSLLSCEVRVALVLPLIRQYWCPGRGENSATACNSSPPQVEGLRHSHSSTLLLRSTAQTIFLMAPLEHISHGISACPPHSHSRLLSILTATLGPLSSSQLRQAPPPSRPQQVPSSHKQQQKPPPQPKHVIPPQSHNRRLLFRPRRPFLLLSHSSHGLTPSNSRSLPQPQWSPPTAGPSSSPQS